MNQLQRLSTIFFLSAIVLLINISCTRPSDKLAVMIDEYKMITPYPDAIRLDTSSSARLNGSLHSTKYESDASWENVSAHYAEQLEQNGWTKVDEGMVPQAGECLSYKKDDLRAFLQFAGAGSGADFAFSLSWSGRLSCQ